MTSTSSPSPSDIFTLPTSFQPAICGVSLDGAIRTLNQAHAAIPKEVTQGMAEMQSTLTQKAREAGAAVADAAMIDQELKDVTRAFTSATSSATNTAKYLLFGRQASDAASDGEYNVTYRKIQPPRRMGSAP